MKKRNPLKLITGRARLHIEMPQIVHFRLPTSNGVSLMG